MKDYSSNIFKIENIKRVKMTDEEYFGKEYLNHLSNSKLSFLNPNESGDYEHFTNKSVSQDDSIMLGTIIHNLVLEPELYYLSDFECPSEGIKNIMDYVFKLTKEGESFDVAIQKAVKDLNYYKGNPGEVRMKNLIKKGKPYYDYLLTSKKGNELIVPKSVRDTVVSITNSIEDNDSVQDLFFNEVIENFYEDVFLCDIVIEDLVIPFKGKLDHWSVDHENKVIRINDLKTTFSAVDNFLGINMIIQSQTENLYDIPTFKEVLSPGSFQKFHYYRQIFIYAEILKQYLLEKNEKYKDYKFECNIVAVQIAFDFDSLVIPIEEEWIEKGRKEFNVLIDFLYLNRKDKITEEQNKEFEKLLNEIA